MRTRTRIERAGVGHCSGLPKPSRPRRELSCAVRSQDARTAATTCGSFTRRGAFARNELKTIEGDVGFPSQEGSASVARLDARPRVLRDFGRRRAICGGDMKYDGLF